MRRTLALGAALSLMLSSSARAWGVPTFDLSDWISSKLRIVQSTTEYIEIVNTVGEIWLMWQFIKQQSEEWEILISKMRNIKHFQPPKVSFYAGVWFTDRPAFDTWMKFMDGGLPIHYDYDGTMTGNPYVAFEDTFSSQAYPDTWDPQRGIRARLWSSTYNWDLAGSGPISIPPQTATALEEAEKFLTLEKASTVREYGNLMASRATEQNNKKAMETLHEWLGEGRSHLASMDLMKAELQMTNTALEQQIELLSSRIERDTTNRLAGMNAQGQLWNRTPQYLQELRAQRAADTAASDSLELR